MWPYRNFLVIVSLFVCLNAYCQQDVDFHLNSHLLPGKTILKVKRDFYDPYLWVLAKNNEVYRVNSLTLAVDDYTVQFSAYNTLQFIDIAGRSRDTVFIATNSSNVIQYKKGNTRLISAADGIPYTVNSIGMEKAVFGQSNRHSLMIATGKGYCTYDMDAENRVTVLDTGSSRVFEATYRRQIYKDSTWATSNFNINDTIQYVPIINKGELTTFVGYLWEGGNQFGYNIHTAYVAAPSIYGYDDVVDYTNYIWGNNRGLFQNNANKSYSSAWTHGHYLDGINVNKVTGIYGLVAFGDGNWFGDPRYIKENLLIGTDQGLYFSSSIYNVPNYGAVKDFYLVHYDELGNIKVNDICVNAASITPPICEDGVWLACDDGLYLIKPDYGKYLNNQQFKAASFRGHPPGLAEAKICTGSSVTAMINTGLYPTNLMQWFKDGIELPAEVKDSLVIKTGGDYYAVVYDPCENIHLETNHLKVQVISAPVFSFNYPERLQYCDSTSVTLKTDNDPTYNYRWYTNGTLNGDTTYHIAITQSGKYKVEVSACQGSWVPPKEVEVDLIQLPLPVIITDKPAYCVGDNATLSIAVPISPGYTINWYKDNVLLSTHTNQTAWNTDIAGNYSVSITNNQSSANDIICTQTSAIQSILFNPLPVVSIQRIVKTTLCDGQTVDLKVSYNDGTVKWSTGQNSDWITINRSGTYKATITTPAGCLADTAIAVQFLSNPILNISNISVCRSSHKTATLIAPSGMKSYTWNGQSGTDTYVTDHPQTVTLSVTDANGCQAEQEIQVTDECPDVKIPNAFTPNGDGINDTWVIAGLEYDQTVLVRVFDRYGQQVYHSKGYGTAWNGEYRGKKLMPGAYYYIITAKDGTQTYSGSLTIIY